MPDVPTPPRRFRFGLRSLFVLVTVLAAGTWVANSLIWVRARQEAVFRGIVAHNRSNPWCGTAEPLPYCNAPGGL